MKWLKYVMLLASVSLAAITKITLPTDFNTVANGTRANLSSNFSEIDTRSDAAFDSVDEVRGRMTGYTGDFTITSLDHLRLRLDSDGSLLGRFFISNGSTGDSLWRVSEDSTWRAFGAGVGTKLTLSDSILAATARISGNGTFGGTLGVTGASTLAALSATTGTFSSTLGVTGASTLAALSATTGSFSSTLAVTGGTTFGGTVRLNNANNIQWLNASAVTRNILALNSSNNLEINGTGDGGINFFVGAGSNGGTVSSAGAWALPSTLAVTGATTLAAMSATTGTFSSYLATASYLSFYDNGASGAGRIFRTAANGLQLRGITGSSYDFGLESAAGSNLMLNPTGTTGLTFPGANGVTVTNALTLSNLTASLPVFTNGSSQLTTNAMTGTGSVMMSASPTTTGTLTAAAITASGAVSTGALTATTATLGGGEAFVYGDTSFTVTLTGVSGSVTGTATASKVGKIITMRLPTLSGTSNATTATITGIPAGWRPDAQVFVPAAIQDNGTYYNVDFRPAAIYGILLETGGTATLALNGNASGFTSSGTKGCYTSATTFLAP